MDRIDHFVNQTSEELSEIRPLEKLESEISSIIRWVEALNEVDTDNIDPMSNSLTGVLRMREDLVTDGNKVSDILSNSPVDDENFFVVPKVIE